MVLNSGVVKLSAIAWAKGSMASAVKESSIDKRLTKARQP